MDIFLHYILPPLVGAAIGYITNWIAVKMLFRPLYPKYIGKWRLPFTPGIIPRRKDALAKAIGRAVGEELLTKEDIQKAFCGEEKRSAVVSGLTDGVMSAAEKNMRTLSADVIAAETFEQKRDALAETLTERAVRALPQLHAGETIAERIDGYLEEHGREKLLPLVKKELYELSETPAGQLLAGIGIDRAAVETIVGNIYDKALLPAVGVAVSSFDISAEVEKKIGEMDVIDVEKLCLSVMKRELNAITWLGGLIGLLLGIVNIFL